MITKSKQECLEDDKYQSHFNELYDALFIHTDQMQLFHTRIQFHQLKHY